MLEQKAKTGGSNAKELLASIDVMFTGVKNGTLEYSNAMEIAGQAFLRLVPELISQGTALQALFASFASSKTLVSGMEIGQYYNRPVSTAATAAIASGKGSAPGDCSPPLKWRGFYGFYTERLQPQSQNVYSCVEIPVHGQTAFRTIMDSIRRLFLDHEISPGTHLRNFPGIDQHNLRARVRCFALGCS
jgi:hypothetical protein